MRAHNFRDSTHLLGFNQYGVTMKKHVHHNALRAAVSAEDLRLILQAVSAHTNKTEDRDLYGRLQVQAAALWVAHPAGSVA